MPLPRRITVSLAFLIAVLTVPLDARDLVIFEEVTIYPGTEENRTLVSELFSQAVYAVNQLYADELTAIGPGEEPSTGAESAQAREGAAEEPASGAVDAGEGSRGIERTYRIEVNAVRDEENESIYMQMTDGESESDFVLFGAWEQLRADYVAQAILNLRGALRGFPDANAAAPPEYVAELPFSLIGQYYTGGPVQYLVPYAAASGGGSLFVAGGQVALELSEHLKVTNVVGTPLAERGVMNAAYAIGATEAGTVYLRPAAGPYIYRFHSTVEEPERFRVQLGAGGTISALEDGSLLLTDPASQGVTRMVEGRSERLDLFLEGYGGIIAPGPESTVWAMDAVRRRIGIYSAEGELLDTVVPMVPQTTFYSTKAMAVTGDGAAVVLTHEALWRVERDGRVAWTLRAGDDPRLPTFQTVNSFTVDRSSGAIYLVDISGQRIVRLLDPHHGTLSDVDRELLELSRAAAAGDTAALERQAELYEELEAYEMALAVWDELSFAEPTNEAARNGRAGAELLLLRAKAERLDRQTREQLALYGPESARSAYSQALQAYERAISLAGGEQAQELRHAKRQLEERYNQRATRPGAESSPLEVASVSIDELFPSLLPLYQSRPAGRMQVKNGGSQPIHDLTIEVLIRRYMDFPAQSDPIGELSAGSEAELPIMVPLSREVLDLEEQLPAQAQITLRYRVGETSFEENHTTRVTIHRRTALSWEESGKLASFVTPNEAVVSRFAHRVVSDARRGRTAVDRVAANGDGGANGRENDDGNGDGGPNGGENGDANGDGGANGRENDDANGDGGAVLGRLIERASRIADAVGTHGMAYIEDPDTPISAILGDESVVDTVRFPRTTLLYRSGDCDDTTALVCSLYESVGIRTAILTSPAHVFMAFDTGEPEAHEWMFETDELEAIRHDGTVWLPVETTVLGQGFYAAWQEATSLYRRHEPAGDIEFIPLSRAWERYRPVPLSAASFELVEPAPERVSSMYTRSLRAMRERLYEAKVVESRAAAEAAEGARAARQWNRTGVLHARYAVYEKALSAFRLALELDGSYQSPRINLANVHILTGRAAEALPVLQEGAAERPSVRILLALAQVYSELDRPQEAQETLDRLAERAPELAARYGYLAQVPQDSADEARASAAAAGPQVLWAAGE